MNLNRTIAAANDAFFAQLPPHKLTQYETELIRLLQEMASVVQAFLPRSMNLQDWAERRVPQEASHWANASGLLFTSSVRPIYSGAAPVKTGTKSAGNAALEKVIRLWDECNK